jgi:hypothetical protein
MAYYRSDIGLSGIKTVNIVNLFCNCITSFYLMKINFKVSVRNQIIYHKMII